ncbi:intermembrane lipid transfer protein Vps13 isoform X2 [Centruroides vittatus]|uniref:intermembrane lipid transfer protein Vps13 isoform X2 n=1 Tax=Centruroides vittatus TaxID=120091 RepID=UPI0035100996
MVFESVVVDILNRFIGDYVENLDRSQLKLGIWGGDVTLARLDVKESALDELDLPVKVVSGHLSNLVLKIPWKNLYTEPVIASIEGLFVIVLPNLATKYNEEKEQKAAQDYKEKELRRIEEMKIKEANKDEKKDEKADTFTEKLVTQIIKNLQVKIKDIHIRYEDPYTDPSKPFSLGITLHNLSFETTDENWKPCILQDTVKLIHKLVILDSFAVYWNSNTTMISNMNAEDAKIQMKHEIATSTTKPSISYILGPINATARLILNSKPETDGSGYKIPKVNLDVVMEEIALRINETQYQDIMKLLQSLDRMARASLYRKYHPSVPLKGNSSVWWKFALQCILEEDIRRRKRDWSWDHMRNHRHLCRDYKEIYKQKILRQKMSKNVQETMQNAEKQLDLFNITLIRKQAELEVAQMKNKGYNSCWSGWFSWFGYGEEKEKKGNKITQQFEEAMTNEEKAKLYEAIGYQENAVPAEYPKEFVENKITFLLCNLVIVIDDMSKKQVMKLQLQKVSTEIEQRPSAEAIKLAAKVETFMVFGTLGKNNITPTMVTSQTVENIKEPLLSVLFETNPLDNSCDSRIYVAANPLEIVYDAATVNLLADVFKPPSDVKLEQLQAAAVTKLEDIKETSALGLQHAIEQHKTLDLKINLMSSYIIVPENGFWNEQSHCLILNLGNFKMDSSNKKQDIQTVKSLVKAGSTDEEVLTEMISQAYDKYNIEIQNMEVIMTNPGENWKMSKEKQKSYAHLIEPINVIVYLQQCIIQEDPRLPKMKISGELPFLNLSISDQKLQQLLALVQSIPLPGSSAEEPPQPATTMTSTAPVNPKITQLTKPATVKVESLSKPEAVDEISHVQYINLEFKFEIKEMGLDLYRKGKLEDTQLLRFAFKRLGTNMCIKTFETAVDLYLGGIFLHHKEFQRCDGSPLYILANKQAESLENWFVLHYLMADKKGPDFQNLYNNTLQSISISFTSLELIVHLEALLSLLDFSNHLMASLTTNNAQENANKIKHEETKSAITTVDTEYKDVTPEKRKGKKSKKAIELIDLKIKAHFSSFGLTICTMKHNLTTITISGIDTDVILQKSKTSVKTCLKEILISDSMPDAVHRKILSVVDEEVLDLEVVMYNFATDDEGYFDMSAMDMKLSVSLGRLKFIFINKFIMSLLSFADNFQIAKEKLAEASVAAAEVAKQGMEMAYEKATRISLDVCVQAPVIVIPQNSLSTNSLVVDLGIIKIHNKFLLGEKRNELGIPAIFEKMTVELHDLKLSRAIIEYQNESISAECLLLEPLTFTLSVVRNLAFNWHKDKPEIDVSGKLKAVTVTISQEDYGTVMKVLAENLAEKGLDIQIVPLSEISPSVPSSTKPAKDESSAAKKDIEISKLIPQKIYNRIIFGLELQSISLSLYEGISDLNKGITKRNNKKALSYIELKTISLSGKIMTDNSLQAEILLIDFILDDTRFTRKTGVKRLMQQNSEQDKNGQKMITVNFIKDAAGDATMDVKIFSFQLIVHLGYLLQLGDFFTKSVTDEKLETATKPESSKAASTDKLATKTNIDKTSAASKQSEDTPTNRTTIFFTLEEPDLILIEDIENINSNIIVLKNAVEMKLIMDPGALNISGAIKDLQIFTACYNPSHRNNTTVQILTPCEINLLYSCPSDKKQHINVDCTEIALHVSPGTIEIISNILATISTKSEVEETVDEIKPVDYSNIWEPCNVNDQSYWFLETVKGKDEAVEITEDFCCEEYVCETTASEEMVLNMKKIILTIEAGRGLRTVPMILLESSFHSEIKDWSSLLYIGCNLTVEMGYYNEKLAVWEPLIEPVELPTGQLKPWEITMQVTKNPLDIPDDDEEEIKFPPPEMSIEISSFDMLEVTVTKTFMNVVTNLSEAFTEAVKSTTVRESIDTAPYIIKNELGIPLTINLSNNIFQVINNDNDQKDVDAVLLETGTKVNFTKTSTGKLQSNVSALKKHDTYEDLFFTVQFEIDGSTCVRTISIARTEKRIFLLPCRTYPGDQWGFVVDIKSCSGSKIITFYSTVEIINYFSIPMEVYYMLSSGNEVQRCGLVEPQKVLHLPLHSVYTPTRELFFKPAEQDFSVSTQPFMWKEIPEDIEGTALLLCSDKNEGGQPFFIEVSRKINRIFFEDSHKKTMVSVSYSISLHPTALLKNLLPYSISYCLQDVKDFRTLEPGESTELWTAEIGKAVIEIKISNYLDHEWICSKKLETSSNELSVWTFEASVNTDKKLVLDLGMRIVKNKGSLEFSLYCPFWMVNKTGLNLKYRKSKKLEKSDSSGSPKTDETNILQHSPEMDFPLLFSFKAKNFFAKKKASLKANESEWSDKFSLDVIGSQGTVLAKCKDGQTYGICVQIKLSNAGLTKIIIFTPFYLILNKSQTDIEIRENVDDALWLLIPSNECKPFWPKDAKKTEMIARYAKTTDETIPFTFKKQHTTLLKCSGSKGGLNVDVQVAEASIILTFDDYHPGYAAVLLVNNLETFPVIYHQVGKTEKALKCKQAVLYTWEDPCTEREFSINIGKKSSKINLAKDGINEIQLESKETVYWVSFLDGLQRVILLTEDLALATAAQQAGELERSELEVVISLQGVGLSLIDNTAQTDILYLCISSSGILWEAKKLKGSRYKALSIKECNSIEQAYQRYQMEKKIGKKPKPRWHLEGKLEVDFGNEKEIMMCKPINRVIRRSFQTGFWLQYKTSPHQLQLHAKINRIQIDNQLRDCVFPVVIAPVPPPKSVVADNAPKPFTEASIIIQKTEFTSVKQFKYCQVLIQEFHVKLDQGFLNSLISFFGSEEITDIDYVKLLAKDKELLQVDLKDVAETYSSQELKHYFDMLHFSPLKIHISFSMTGGSSQDEGQPTAIHSEFLNLLLQSIGVTLTEVQDIIFRLDYFQRDCVFRTQRQLINEASRHYINQSLKQLYMLVLGLDVIGNPVGLLFGLSEGVGDFFYEPFQGAIQGPEEFAEGLALGVKSLFGHAVGGAAGAVSRITGTLGKGLAALTLDDEYQKKRRQVQSRRPQDLRQGLAQSGKGLVMGVFEGVTGIVTKPIEGAREGGAGGFFKGVGKGLLGVVVRPTSGVADFTSESLEAVKRATELTDEVKRVRSPRFIRTDGIVRPYSKIEAEGFQLFCDVEKGKFVNTDHYVVHCPVGSDGKMYLMITTNRLMLITKGDVFGQWSTDWHYTWEEIVGTEIIPDKGIKIILKEGKKKKGIFGNKDTSKLVTIKQKELCEWMNKKIEEEMKKIL